MSAAPCVLVLVGSPRADGRSARLAGELASRLSERGARVHVWSLATRPVAACTGCGSCSRTGRCRVDDAGWGELEPLLEEAALLFVVAPLCFAGPTPRLAAFLSRCQVFWARRYELGEPLPPKRPAHLLVVGEGGDPFGSAPFVTMCTSALNNANLRIVPERVHDFVGQAYDVSRAENVAAAALGELDAQGADTVALREDTAADEPGGAASTDALGAAGEAAC